MALSEGDAAGLRAILGDAGLVTAEDASAPYVTDFWRLHQGLARCVARPASTEAVQALVRFCGERRWPIVPQSGNTGLVGGGLPDRSGEEVLLSLDRMTRIRGLTRHHLVAEAGCILEDVQRAAAEIGRLFPLSLGAEGSCRIGGNVATNAGGINVLRYGMTRRLVLGLEVVLADGTLLDGLKSLPKDNTGYDLKQLFIGSEGTLGIVTAATLALSPMPRERHDIWLAVRSPKDAVELHARFAESLGETISAFELIADAGVEAAERHFGIRILQGERSPWHVLATVAWSFPDGLMDHLETLLAEVMEADLVQDGAIAQNEAQRQAMWRIREGQSEAMTREGAVWRSDVAVAIEAIPELVARCAQALPPLVERAVLFPFGHLGDGNLHVNVQKPGALPMTPEERRSVQETLFAIVAELGGSFSAEHGIGRWKKAALATFKDPAQLALMRRIKRMLDPDGLLNPGVMLDP